jgi:stage V sporulation protein D (sporulation-specific penicillin-binding protein)
MSMYRKIQEPLNKLNVLTVISFIVAGIIVAQLFNLQIIEHRYYQEKAAKEHYGYTELPARRGEIVIKDHHSEEEFRLATNTTLDLLYADPSLIDNPEKVAATLAPLIFDLEEWKEKDAERIKELKKTVSPDVPEEEIDKILKLKTDEELMLQFKEELTTKLSQKRRLQILLVEDLASSVLEKISGFNLEGVKVVNNKVYVYPPIIINAQKIADTLAPYVEIPATKLESIITSENRYTVLKKKLRPEISTKLKEIKTNDKEGDFVGIGTQEEYYRFYPEKSLAANLIGFVDHEGTGQYGIESKFNSILRGKKGVFQTQKDSIGRQITVGESVIKPAEDGDNVVLTIDRSVQLEVDRLVQKAVEDTRADAGLAVVMDPQTGAITAISHFPSFDPNSFSAVFEKEPIHLNNEEKEALVTIDEENGIYYLYRNVDTDDKLMIFKEIAENGEIIYKKFKNNAGPIAYQNKAVSWPYEPGSVFKPVAMAIALDDHEVTPNTTFFDSGPIKVDEFEIHNSTDDYYGRTTMTTVLDKSLNTGMAFIARKIGRTLFGSYLKKFGFGERTDIEFLNEHPGKIQHHSQWAESELVTHAFGQGLTATPLQVANAYSVIANGGILMQPHIVSEIRKKNGKVLTTEPNKVRRVISEQTSSTLSAMLVSAVENGVASPAQVPYHYVAGKTGTSQTYKWGKPLKGAGTTLTSFGGYGPIANPRFVVIVKLEHPRSSEWGAKTAAPLFRDIAKYLFNYYNIPPDKDY